MLIRWMFERSGPQSSEKVLYNHQSCLRGEVDIMRPSEGRVTGSIPVGGTT